MDIGEAERKIIIQQERTVGDDNVRVVREVNLAMKIEKDPEKLLTYGKALASWLDAIERLRRLRAQGPEP